MDAVEILFGFYKTIPGFFQQVWGTAEAEPDTEAEVEAQPEPEKPKEPVVDWPTFAPPTGLSSRQTRKRFARTMRAARNAAKRCSRCRWKASGRS